MNDNDDFTRQSEQFDVADQTYNSNQYSSLCSFARACKQAFGMTRGLMTALCYTYVITFIVFPALSQVATKLSFVEGSTSTAWLSLILLTTFNMMDTLGRCLAGMSCMGMKRRGILVLSYLRTLHVGFFLCSAFELQPEWLFGSDWFKLLNFSTFALTHGYYSSLQCMQVPEVVKKAVVGAAGQNDQSVTTENVGAFIGVAKMLGILIGATLGVPTKEVIKLTPGARA